MLTRSCFSMLPQRLPPGHSVQSPPRSGYSSAQTSVYPSPLLPHWAAAQTLANLSAHLHRLPTPPPYLRRMRLLPAGVRRCHEALSGESCWQRYHEASSGESCWQGCHEALSGRACWRRLTKTRTKKSRTKKPGTKKPRTKKSGTKKPCTKKTVHGGECARDGNRTRTDISAHRILSPACLPIPPLEQCKFRLEGQRYYFLSSYEPFLIYFCNLV